MNRDKDRLYQKSFKGKLIDSCRKSYMNSPKLTPNPKLESRRTLHKSHSSVRLNNEDQQQQHLCTTYTMDEQSLSIITDRMKRIQSTFQKF